MKYYSAYAEVDLDAIRHNIIEMKQHIRPTAKTMAVVKADAYGHGAAAVVDALTDIVDYFAVAHGAEAVELRNHGIDKPLLILGYSSPEEFQTLLENQITITLFHLEDGRELSRLALELGQRARIHIKIDTGMNRIGFPCNSHTISVIQELAALPGLEIEGIFTHFAKADEMDKTAMGQQLDRFRSLLDGLQAAEINIPLRHAANSAAILEAGDFGFEMVRSGISTYGLYPSDEVDKGNANLIPAMSLRSRIAHVKTVPAGEGISYGWSYVTERESRIATVPVGYADGYKRALSGKARVLIHGRSAPVVGRICMDQFMVDVSQIPDVQIGDMVTLFGRDGDEYLPVEELADAAASFNYEFICGIARRIPRIYIRDGRKIGVQNYLAKETDYKNTSL